MLAILGSLVSIIELQNANVLLIEDFYDFHGPRLVGGNNFIVSPAK